MLYIRRCEGSVNGGRAYLHRNDGVKHPDCCLEGFEEMVFIWEDTEAAIVNPQTNTSRDGFLRGLEPSVTLGLGSSECQIIVVDTQ